MQKQTLFTVMNQTQGTISNVTGFSALSNEEIEFLNIFDTVLGIAGTLPRNICELDKLILSVDMRMYMKCYDKIKYMLYTKYPELREIIIKSTTKFPSKLRLAREINPTIENYLELFPEVELDEVNLLVTEYKIIDVIQIVELITHVTRYNPMINLFTIELLDQISAKCSDYIIEKVKENPTVNVYKYANALAYTSSYAIESEYFMPVRILSKNANRNAFGGFDSKYGSIVAVEDCRLTILYKNDSEKDIIDVMVAHYDYLIENRSKLCDRVLKLLDTKVKGMIDLKNLFGGEDPSPSKLEIAQILEYIL
jgi:hypothetical protein